MALDTCSDCGGSVSPAAFVCPHCGRPRSLDAQGAVRPRHWELGTVIAALIGLLALGVSGYTAWIQREQVRAQVWPHLLIGYSDPERELVVFNKGVGPALVRSVEITVDGKPQQNWTGVFHALGMQVSGDWQHSTLAGNVLSPEEKMVFMSLPTQAQYQQFRTLAGAHLQMHVCFCSTLGDCWMQRRRQTSWLPVEAVAACPSVAPAAAFHD